MVELRSITPDASPEEVAAIVAALGALQARPVPGRRSRRHAPRVGARGAPAVTPFRVAARPLAPVGSLASPHERLNDTVVDAVVVPNHAELMSVGCDEVVVTFTTTEDAEVATRVGDHRGHHARHPSHRGRR